MDVLEERAASGGFQVLESLKETEDSRLFPFRFFFYDRISIFHPGHYLIQDVRVFNQADSHKVRTRRLHEFAIGGIPGLLVPLAGPFNDESGFVRGAIHALLFFGS